MHETKLWFRDSLTNRSQSARFTKFVSTQRNVTLAFFKDPCLARFCFRGWSSESLPGCFAVEHVDDSQSFCLEIRMYLWIDRKSIESLIKCKIIHSKELQIYWTKSKFWLYLSDRDTVFLNCRNKLLYDEIVLKSYMDQHQS